MGMSLKPKANVRRVPAEPEILTPIMAWLLIIQRLYGVLNSSSRIGPNDQSAIGV